jgi:threonine dehydrogenase-like Zn-dependent dehydrogenase
MKAVRFSTTGGPEVLEVVDIDAPTPGPGQVLVDVEYAGVNFIDTYHRSGLYPMPLPSGNGLEGVGTISALGEGVTDRQVGQRIAWADTVGSYAEQVAVKAARSFVVPDGVDSPTACALALQGMTAHYLAFSTFPLGKEHTALVYAAAGGVGRILVQLAVQRGARVLACTSTEEKADAVRALGAHEVIPYRDVDVAARVRELTGGRRGRRVRLGRRRHLAVVARQPASARHGRLLRQRVGTGPAVRPAGAEQAWLAVRDTTEAVRPHLDRGGAGVACRLAARARHVRQPQGRHPRDLPARRGRAGAARPRVGHDRRQAAAEGLIGTRPTLHVRVVAFRPGVAAMGRARLTIGRPDDPRAALAAAR